ncbi:MAG: RidA family protein [Chitinophagales bacterium]
MNKTIIKTENAPAPIGPYNQAVKTNDTLYVSGQIAIDPKSGALVIDNIQEETEMVMENLKAVVEAAGLTMENIVKTCIFISDMDNFALINEVYGSYFEKDFPARECVEVSVLPKRVNVEISCIAVF